MPVSRNSSRGGRVHLSPERRAEYDRVLMMWHLGQVKGSRSNFGWEIDGKDVSHTIRVLRRSGRIASSPRVTSYGDMKGWKVYDETGEVSEDTWGKLNKPS